jgi:hypothetical protein
LGIGIHEFLAGSLLKKADDQGRVSLAGFDGKGRLFAILVPDNTHEIGILPLHDPADSGGRKLRRDNLFTNRAKVPTTAIHNNPRTGLAENLYRVFSQGELDAVACLGLERPAGHFNFDLKLRFR